MKKIIVGFLALALLLVGNSAFASGPFNGDPEDCSPTIGIGNYSTGNIPRDSYGCWTASSISASAGDTVNVAMYYHNNTNSTLNNVRAVVTKSSSGPANSYSFTGSMSSSQGSQTFGTVTLNLNSSQTLTYSSTHLMKGEAAVLSNTDTSVVYTESGIDVGSVSTAWEDYGTIVFVYKVGTTNETNNCTISNFNINGSSSATITSGSSANLNWSTNGCTSATITGPNGTLSSSLSSNLSVSTSGTYRITAYGSNGQSVTRTAELYVNDNQSYCSISNFTINGSSSATIQSGNPVTLNWSTNGYNSVTVSGPNGFFSSSLSDSRQVFPTTSGTYTITGSGSNCQNNYQTRTVYVNVNQVVVPPPVINACAVTTVATNVTQNSATLNGLLTGSTGASYFQYGTSINLGSQTVSRVGSGQFSEVITGLAPNTPYYFRFVSNCGGGLSYGQIQVFQTQGVAGVNTIRQVVVQGTTVIGTASPIMLKIENRYQYIGLGDIVDYTVTYKNIGKTTLTKPILQVIVPSGITLINSSRGTYSTDTNTLTVQLEDLLPNAEGVVYLQGRVDMITSGVAQIVTTAVLVYTSPSGAQENAIAYVLNNPRDIGNVLGASAFWAGFWNMGLIGWLLLLILILLIILLTRRYYGTSRSVVQKTTPTGTSTTTTHY